MVEYKRRKRNLQRVILDGIRKDIVNGQKDDGKIEKGGMSYRDVVLTGKD